MKLLKQAFAVVLPLCVFILAGCASPSAHFRSGGISLNDKDYEFSKALAHFSRGLLYEAEQPKNLDKALAEFDAASKCDPKSITLYNRIATDALRMREPDKAIRALEQACREDPDSAQRWIDLAATCQVCGQSDLAINYYGEALKLAPTNALLYVELARIHFRDKRDSEVLKTIKRGLKKADNPRLILAFVYSVGRETLENKEIQRGIQYLQLVADNIPSQRQQFYYLLGELYAGIGEEKAAIYNYTMATKQEPPLPDPFVKLAVIQLESDKAKAIKTLLEAERRIPDNPMILFSLACVYSSQKQFEKAINTFEKVRDITERSGQKLSPGFYLNYGSAFERSGRTEMAERIFQQCILLYPDAREALNYLAYMWAEKGVNLDKALEYVNTALELDPDNGAYIDTRGWIYYQQKEYTKALQQISEANELIKDDPTISDHLGDALQAMNESDKALYYWKRSFILDPTSESVAGKLKARGVNLAELRKEAAKRPKPPDRVEQ